MVNETHPPTMGAERHEGGTDTPFIGCTVHVATLDGGERQEITKLLTEQGAHVISHPTTNALWQALPTPPPETSLPIYILAEDRSGTSMSGIALTERIRAAHLPFPVFLIGCEPTIPRAVRAIRAGAAEYLTRPLLAHRLLESIAQYQG